MNDDEKIITPAIPTYVKTNPGNAVIISKLNADPLSTSNKSKLNYLSINMPDVSEDIRNRIKNNEDIVQLFPDVELSIQILTSSILSPNDMMTTNLIYELPSVTLPIDVKNTVLDTIKKYVKTNYDLETKLNKILRDSLFIKGAYIEAIIPEASLDEVINSDGQVSVESINSQISKQSTGIGLLAQYDVKDREKAERHNFTISAEDLSDIKYVGNNITTKSEKQISLSLEDFGVEVTDNFNVLRIQKETQKRLPAIVKTSISKAIGRRPINISSEEKSDLESFFKNNNGKMMTPVVTINTSDATVRESIGKPLVMEISTEACVPVHVVNNPSKHLGYFILLDGNGVPVDVNTELSEGLDPNLNYASTDSKLNLIKKAKDALFGITKKDTKLENLESIYNIIVDNTIKDKLRNGVYGELAELKDSADIYRVMFMRTLKARKTRLLYLPSELVMYYAFDYRSNGTGKSMLEKVAMLFSIRSILLFSKIMATVKNSVSVTKIEAILDENDTDPEKTMEKIISESLKTRQTQLPVGIMNIDDLVQWSHKVGMRYNFKHSSLPDMTIDIADESSSKAIPDMELDEMIQKHIIMSFGLTPEIVESGYSSDFATTVMAKNLLFAKRVVQLQKQLLPQVSDHTKKLLYNDEDFIAKLRTILTSNVSSIESFIKKQLKTEDESETNIKPILKKKDAMVEYMIDSIIEDINVDIANSEVKEARAMQESYEAYKAVIDDTIAAILSSEALPSEIFGELSGKIDTIQAIIKAGLIKRWMSDNGYLPELSEFLTLGEDGKPIFNLLEEYSVYADNLTNTVLDFMKANEKAIKKSNDRLAKITESAEPIDENDSGTGDEGISDGAAESQGDGDDVSGDEFGTGEDEFAEPADTGDLAQTTEDDVTEIKEPDDDEEETLQTEEPITTADVAVDDQGADEASTEPTEDTEVKEEDVKTDEPEEKEVADTTNKEGEEEKDETNEDKDEDLKNKKEKDE